MLRGFGFDTVEIVQTGIEASHAVRERSDHFDLVLMDIHMPLLDGVGATTEIRKAGINIPIIAVTANALKGAAEAFLAKGMNDYIPKPVERELLMRTLLKWLE